MEFRETRVENVLVLTVAANRIASDVAPAFKQQLAEYASKGNRKIVLDLSEVAFIDSSALGSLIGVLKLIGNDGELAVCSVQENVKTMFKLTRMNKIFRIFDTREDAISALS